VSNPAASFVVELLHPNALEASPKTATRAAVPTGLICLDLFDLFGDCFLFIPIVCLYVMIVDRREQFVRGI
jgi:hypothetical protein